MNTTKAVFNKLYSKKTELATQKVELGYLQNVANESEKSVKKFSNTKDIINAWQKVRQTINSISSEVSLVRKKRKANIIGIEGHIEDIKTDIDFIENKFKEVGLNPKDSKELMTAKKNAYVLGNFLKDLKSIDSLEDVNI